MLGPFRPSRIVHVNPLFFAGLVMLKKAAVLAGINSYGVHRLYRRLLEIERHALPKTTNFRSVNSTIKTAIRSPQYAVNILSSNPAVVTVIKQVNDLSSAAKYIPIPQVRTGVQILSKLIEWSGILKQPETASKVGSSQPASSASVHHNATNILRGIFGGGDGGNNSNDTTKR